ncbi:hypothetical protein DL764_006267 [Monosporascus ibericus]|uniref:Uncharacterized protein n=1 Tax=Monosporascus ibericus TaxID=155417 RepID=A0A4Q4T784_9PEZI|nr:hypothetical protein DL764_006267 [Monosporascus ibericus]
MLNPTRTLLLPLLLSPCIAAAASNGWSWEAHSRSEFRTNDTVVYDRQRVAWGHFEASIWQLNATGRTPFTGRDVSRPYYYAGGRDLDGWPLAIDVTDVTNINRDDDHPDWDADIKDGADDDDDDAWRLCATVYGISPSRTANYTQVAQEDGGTCHSYMSEGCIDTMTRAAEDSYRANRTCQYWRIPEQCLGSQDTPGDPE